MSVLPPNTSLKRSDWVIIYGVWAITQMAILMTLGINDRFDAAKFIDQAKELTQGTGHFSWNDLFYSGYIALHVLLRLVGLPAKAIYGIQLLASALAVNYYIRTLNCWGPSRQALLISGILYAACFITQEWVSLLFTDSLFFSLLTIGIYYLINQKQHPILFWLFLLLLPLFRPVGFLFAILAFVYWFLLSWRAHIGKIALVAAFLLFWAGWIFFSLTQSQGFFYPNHNSEANVICGYPSGLLRFQRVPYHEGMSIIQYFTLNPSMTLRLFFFRFVKIFSMGRPYYSDSHNLALTLIPAFYYLLALAGLLYLFVTLRRIAWFLLAGMLIFCIPSIVFCVDWSGRFSLPVLAFVLLLSGIGVGVIDERVRR